MKHTHTADRAITFTDHYRNIQDMSIVTVHVSAESGLLPVTIDKQGSFQWEIILRVPEHELLHAAVYPELERHGIGSDLCAQAKTRLRAALNGLSDGTWDMLCSFPQTGS